MTRGWSGLGVLVAPLFVTLLAGSGPGVAAEGTRALASSGLGSPAKYTLTAQQAAGLPVAIVLEDLPAPHPAAGPPGQEQTTSGGAPPASPKNPPPLPTPRREASLRRLRFLDNEALATGSQPLFLVRGEWTFLAEGRFRQVDRNGNRLVLLPDGRAQVFNKNGLLLGDMQDPALGSVHQALLMLTM